jgi:hypothetical protein
MRNKKKWRFLTIATVLFFLGAGIYFVILPVQESKRLEQSLVDRFDWPEKYTPPATGSVPPERVEAFIRVREAVQPNCAIFQGILNDIISLEAVEADQEMSAAEKTSKGLGSFKSMFNAAPAFLEFMDARNLALLEEEMGLGEYFYLYLAAYGPQLAREPDSPYAAMEEAYMGQRTRQEFALILGNQLTALESSSQAASNQELLADLRAQIEGLASPSKSPPWPNGPVGMLGETLSPYRDHLEKLYCSGIVKTELLQKNRGLNFKG